MSESIVVRNFEAKYQDATNMLYRFGLKSLGIYGPDIASQMDYYLEHVFSKETDMNDIFSFYKCHNMDNASDGTVREESLYGFWVSVVLESDEVVGCVAVTPSKEYGTDTISLQRMSVSTSYRRRGIGGMLIMKLKNSLGLKI